MFFTFSILLYTAIFILELEIATFREEWFAFLIFPLIITNGVIGKKNGKRWFFSISSVIFSVSVFLMLYFIDFGIEKQLFIFLSGFIYYLSLFGEYRLSRYAKDKTAKGMIAASSMASIFLFFSASYGVYLNFVIPLWVLMFFYFCVSFVISLQCIKILNDNNKLYLQLIYSFVLAFSIMEVAWVINFWPFGYLVTGTIVLIVYYILWDFVQNYFMDSLSKKRLVANSIFFTVVILVILTTSRWLPNI